MFRTLHWAHSTHPGVLWFPPKKSKKFPPHPICLSSLVIDSTLSSSFWSFVVNFFSSVVSGEGNILTDIPFYFFNHCQYLLCCLFPYYLFLLLCLLLLECPQLHWTDIRDRDYATCSHAALTRSITFYRSAQDLPDEMEIWPREQPYKIHCWGPVKTSSSCSWSLSRDTHS